MDTLSGDVLFGSVECGPSKQPGPLGASRKRRLLDPVEESGFKVENMAGNFWGMVDAGME